MCALLNCRFIGWTDFIPSKSVFLRRIYYIAANHVLQKICDKKVADFSLKGTT
jgi:hypothetical protein